MLVGDDPASQVYVRGKEADLRRMRHPQLSLPPSGGYQQQALLDLIRKLNDAPEVDGILVQLPLPAPLDAER